MATAVDNHVVVCQVGFGNYTQDRFVSAQEAKAYADKLWCCWVIFRVDGSSIEEIASGGVGFAAPAIRTYAFAALKQQARDVDARAAAAAAAAARAEAVAAKQTKPSARPAAAGSHDGKPDLANPVSWE